VMEAMPRPRPPHLHREVTRHGRTVWYVRVGKGPRIRLRAEFGSPDFDAEYQAAFSGTARPPRSPATTALEWLVARYRETSDWSVLSVATRRQRENILRHVLETAGDKPFARVDAVAINAGIERRAKTPAQAHHFVETMRGLFKWAKKAGMVKVDPTAGAAAPRRKEGPGFPAWTENDVENYERRWPVGTRERVWLDVLLYTGLRRGDAVRLGRQHVRNGIAQLATEKTGIVVTLPILPVLAATLEAGPCGDLTFIVGEHGQPLTKESFGNMFRDACRAAGVSRSAHGVRKIAATRAANAGATVAQLEAIFGWSGGRMASLYTRMADRQRLAREAMGKLDKASEANAMATFIPAPKGKVRALEPKTK
jgi:integrase